MNEPKRVSLTKLEHDTNEQPNSFYKTKNLRWKNVPLKSMVKLHQLMRLSKKFKGEDS